MKTHLFVASASTEDDIVAVALPDIVGYDSASSQSVGTSNVGSVAAATVASTAGEAGPGPHALDAATLTEYVAPVGTKKDAERTSGATVRVSERAAEQTPKVAGGADTSERMTTNACEDTLSLLSHATIVCHVTESALSCAETATEKGVGGTGR